MSTFRVRFWRHSLLPLAAILMAACSTRSVPQSSGAMQELAGVAPVLSVERFLQAVNAQDFDAMSRIFGTAEGPVRGEPSEVELRMSILSELLRHRDYTISSERMQPGRVHPTRRVGVDLTIGDRVIPDVAFLVVRTERGTWMIEEIDVEKVSSRQ